jgi:hypothetical protein
VEVSPPHQPIHSWKDFLLHLLTITIGLFIALTLDRLPESELGMKLEFVA